MADAKAYAEWLVANPDKKGTPKFEKVAEAYAAARQIEPQPVAVPASTQPAPKEQVMPYSDIAITEPVMSRAESIQAMKGVGGKVADVALEGGGGAMGQAVGAFPALSGPTMGLSVPVGGFIGGAAGNTLAQLRQRSNGERTGFSVPEAVGAGVASMIPGAPMAGAGVKAVAKEGLKQGAANLAGVAVETIGEQKKLPTIPQAALAVGGSVVGAGIGRGMDTGAKVIAADRRAIDNAVRDQTLSAARAAGYKVTPSQLSDAPAVTRALEWLAGGPQTAAATENTARTVNLALARKAIGMPENQVLNLESLAKIRESQGAVYAEVEKVSNKAAQALQDFRKARDRSRAFWLENDRNGTVVSGDAARAWDLKAEAAKDKLEQELKDAGKADLIDKWNYARTTIAKVHLIEDAFSEGEGAVMADLIARRRKAGKTITTDELETMANFAQATGLKGGKPNKVSVVAHPLAAFGAVGSGMYQGGPGAALIGGGIAFGAPLLAKEVLLSNRFQNALMTPSYRPAMPMDFKAAIGQLSAMGVGREAGRQEEIRPVPYR